MLQMWGAEGVSWWNVVHKGTKAAVRTADGHYSRQKPGTPQFTRPGKNIVLLCRYRTRHDGSPSESATNWPTNS